MKLYFVLLIILFISCSSQDSSKIKYLSNENSSKNKGEISNTSFILDTLIIKSINISEFLENEKIIYHLKVTDWNKPVKWTFLIVNKMDTLFSYKSNTNEEKVDELLKVEDLWTNCNSYLECKKNWYLNDIHKIYIETIKPEDYRRDLYFQTSKQFAVMENSVYGLTKKSALNSFREFWSIYQDKDLILFNFNYDPEIGMTPLMAYHPVLKKLVPLYAP